MPTRAAFISSDVSEPALESTAPDFSALTLRPIGFIRTGKNVKFQAGHQPDEKLAEDNFLELAPDPRLRSALADLEGFDRVWLIWWFHQNPNWRPLVIPPRGPQKRRGLFATRSPHRPAPLGITPVLLRGIEPGGLRLGPCDLVDGTPVFDIKPYVPSYDSFPDARAGWIDEVDAAEAAPPAFTVALEPSAAAQAEWLRAEWGIDFLPRATALLARDPAPHRTRRIRRTESGFELGCGAWRALFTVDPAAARVTISSLGPAYPLRFLRREDPSRPVPDREAQLAYLVRWPEAELPLKAK